MITFLPNAQMSGLNLFYLMCEKAISRNKRDRFLDIFCSSVFIPALCSAPTSVSTRTAVNYLLRCCSLLISNITLYIPNRVLLT